MGTMSSPVGDTRTRGDQTAFQQFVFSVRRIVDARLASWLNVRVTEARSLGRDVAAVAEAVRELALRGGKRMRAVLLAAAYHGYDGIGGVEAVAPAGAALELLQVYLLAHDDWMDGDEVRRGGPSIPAMMKARFGHEGPAASILAGDLASAWALGSMFELTLAPERVALASMEFARVGAEVVQGQVLDVCTSPSGVAEIEAMYALKTGSYTVRGPIVMGARLAGADAAQVTALAAFAEPLGVAFQLRDDVLDIAGDAGTTGKPRGSDLRKGKRTTLVVEAMRDPRSRRLLDRVLGRADASEEDLAAAVDHLAASESRQRVEERIAVLVGRSLEALDRTRVSSAGRTLLAQAAAALTERDR
jgi:geranylgeranyl diphosphate synthase, type I